MTLPWIFGTQVGPISLSDLDDNFNALGALTPIPCMVSGTNALALTPAANTPAIASYSNYMQFIGIAGFTNTTAVTAAVGALAPLSVYSDSALGPIALEAGGLTAGSAFTLTYDSALGSGSGGFHIQTSISVISITRMIVTDGNFISGTLSRIATRLATLTHTVVGASSTQDQTATLTGIQTTDQVLVTPPASCASVAGLIYSGYVTANGTVAVRVANVTGASITPPASMVFRLTGLGIS